jgi:hypothetical protein
MERESSLVFLLNAKLTCLIITVLDFFVLYVVISMGMHC